MLNGHRMSVFDIRVHVSQHREEKKAPVEIMGML